MGVLWRGGGVAGGVVGGRVEEGFVWLLVLEVDLLVLCENGVVFILIAVVNE